MVKFKTINLNEINNFESNSLPYGFRAQYNANEVVVYQAYNDDIANCALQHQGFKEKFSFNRWSWIKPSFFWMMHRSEWATKPNQERVLAIHLPRDFFQELISLGVPTQPLKEIYNPFKLWKPEYDNEDNRKKAVSKTDVVFQLDPERDYKGHRCGKRAIQIGMRRDVLKKYALEETLFIEDITAFVHEQHRLIKKNKLFKVRVPEEKLFKIT